MGFLQKLIDGYRHGQEHKTKRRQFLESVTRSISDGTLTEEEMRFLQDECAKLGLEEADLKRIRVQIYDRAFAITKADGKITHSEEAELEKVRQLLGIPASELTHTDKEFRRLRLIAEIQNGNLPVAQAPNVVLQREETAHWVEPGEILEERVISRRYKGGSHGLSFRICKGVSYRVGSHRGHIVAKRAVVPISTGELVLTSKRAIFRGNAKSFNIRLDKILHVEFYRDGIQITDSGGKPKVVRFSSAANTDLVGAILGQVINRYNL